MYTHVVTSTVTLVYSIRWLLDVPRWTGSRNKDTVVRDTVCRRVEKGIDLAGVK